MREWAGGKKAGQDSQLFRTKSASQSLGYCSHLPSFKVWFLHLALWAKAESSLLI